MLQVVLTIVFYVWLFSILALLIIYLRSTARSVDAAIKSAEAAQVAARTAEKLAALLEKRLE